MLVPHAQTADDTARFPRETIGALAQSGLIAERWTGDLYGDPGRAVVLAEELGRSGVGGVGVGVGVQFEAVYSLLRRYSRSELLRAVAEDVLSGAQIGCFAASEDNGGSDLTSIGTIATKTESGWHIKGHKAFVSLGGLADFALVLCTTEPNDGSGMARLIVAHVPREGFKIESRLHPVGSRALETVRVQIDAVVPDDAILGAPGSGLMVATWGLTHERLASAAQISGGMELAIGLATAHMRERRQFGVPLEGHQALRHRVAAVSTEAMMLRLALYAFVACLDGKRPTWSREVAAFKYRAAQLADSAVSDCMHILGGIGYLEDRSPFARLWRDSRLSHLGGGSDEMMLEMIYGGLQPLSAEYDTMVVRRAPQNRMKT